MKKFLKMIVAGILILGFGTVNASVLFPVGGGIGTSTAPTYGQIPVGWGDGTYGPMATSSLGLSSQWTTSGSNIYYNTGNVGIGTTSPWAQFSINAPAGVTSFAIGSSTGTLLSVNSDGTVTGSTANSGIFTVKGTSGATFGIGNVSGFGRLDSSTGSIYTSSSIIIDNPSGISSSNGDFPITANSFSSDSKITLTTSLAGVESEKVRITGPGFVGIGTTTPWAKLSVGSANASTQAPLFVVASSSSAVGTSTAFLIDALGKVGIGTTSPGYTLSVSTQAQQLGTIPLFQVASTTGANLFNVLGNGDVNLSTTGRLASGNKLGGGNGVLIGSASLSVGGTVDLSSSAAGTAAFSINMAGDANTISVLNGANQAFVINGASSKYKAGFGTSTPWGVLSVNETTNYGSIPQFVVGSSTKTSFLVNSSGSTGFGTTTTNTALVSVYGDVEISDVNKGVVMHDTVTGTCYRIQVTSGILVPTSITCP